MANVTPEELRLFHTTDRELYVVLVKDLSRDAMESLRIMGLWLWLERQGSSNLIHKILSLPLQLIETLVNEAMACLNCLDGPPVCLTTQLPISSDIFGFEEISIRFFLENRVTALNGVQGLVSEVCIPVLSDLMERALRGGYRNRPAQNQLVPHPVQGAQGMSAESLLRIFTRMGIRGDPRQGPNRGDTRCNRTMFVTFSRGYPVSDVEVWSFIVRTQGYNCIESIYMQDVPPGEQAIYAKVVFAHASYIESVLSGDETVRISINGKHVRMRKYT